MASMTLAVDDALRKRMKKHPEVKWSEVARSAIRRQLDDLEEMDRLALKSRLTEEDAREIAGKVDEEMARHYERLFGEARNRR